jgi:hypothetical protein
MKLFQRSLITALAFAGATPTSLQAYGSGPSVNFVTTESGIRHDAAIDWIDFVGPAPAQVPLHGLPGYTATITQSRSRSQMGFELQSPVAPGLAGYIQGAFGPLEHVLWTGFGQNGPMTLTFSSPVAQVACKYKVAGMEHSLRISTPMIQTAAYWVLSVVPGCPQTPRTIRLHSSV